MEEKDKTTTSSDAINGSPSKPYQLAIIGGGPAGTAILIRAARLGNLIPQKKRQQ